MLVERDEKPPLYLFIVYLKPLGMSRFYGLKGFPWNSGLWIEGRAFKEAVKSRDGDQGNRFTAIIWTEFAVIAPLADGY